MATAVPRSTEVVHTLRRSSCLSVSNPCVIMCSLCLCVFYVQSQSGSVHGSMEPASYTGQRWETHGTPRHWYWPIRGFLDSIKAMMKGEVYIGRGCRQRGLRRSPYCNNYKVSNYGRRAAVELFEKHLLSSPKLLEELWTLSGCRLACRCRPEQDCHGDVIIRQFRLRHPSAHDHNDPFSAAPKTNELQFLAKLRETTESDDGSTADESAPPERFRMGGIRSPDDGGFWLQYSRTLTVKPWRRQVDGQPSFESTPKTAGGREWNSP